MRPFYHPLSRHAVCATPKSIRYSSRPFLFDECQRSNHIPTAESSRSRLARAFSSYVIIGGDDRSLRLRTVCGDHTSCVRVCVTDPFLRSDNSPSVCVIFALTAHATRSASDLFSKSGGIILARDKLRGKLNDIQPDCIIQARLNYTSTPWPSLRHKC